MLKYDLQAINEFFLSCSMDDKTKTAILPEFNRVAMRADSFGVSEMQGTIKMLKKRIEELEKFEKKCWKHIAQLCNVCIIRVLKQ